MDDRQVARWLAIGRVAIGILLLMVPRRAGQRWIGEAAAAPGGTVALRALGARDAVLGLGALHALETGQPVRPWIQAGAAADASDAVATAIGWGAVGSKRALPAMAVAAMAAALGIKLAESLER